MPDAQLEERGYVLLEDFIPPVMLDRLLHRIGELFESEGEQAGCEFRQEPGCGRLANLVNKGEVFLDVLRMKQWRPYVSQVLGSEFKLSSMNARIAYPQSPRQPLHTDMGGVADERGPWVCNCVWMLDDFTPANGALRAIPGSHRWPQTPQQVLANPLLPHEQEERITGPAGSLIVMNAHLWHSGLANETEQERLALHVFFCRRDKPQQQYQRQLVDDGVQKGLEKDLCDLLALHDPLNDELSGRTSQQSGFLK